MRRLSLFCLPALIVFAVSTLQAQSSNPELVQISPPTIRRAPPPSATATLDELEKRGDELLMQRYKEAGKEFEHAIHLDHSYADAVNNLGVIDYESKKFGKAIKQYQKALKLRADSASFYSNMGAAYFGKKEFEKATESYATAIELDPYILDRTSHNGISAQLPSPEDRARFDYIIAKLCAKRGDSDRSLQYLRRALEEGYKGIDNDTKIPSSRVFAMTPGSPS